jgi:hypothetical protein
MTCATYRYHCRLIDGPKPALGAVHIPRMAKTHEDLDSKERTAG